MIDALPTRRPPLRAASADAAVALHDVSKSYRRAATTTAVLTNVNLTIGRGECVFLLGPSGSGKTTLLSIIGCVLTPDAGEVQILGRSLRGLDSPALALMRRDQIGFVFQRHHLIRGLTALENVCVPLTLAGWSRGRARDRGRELLDCVGLSDKADAAPDRLSVGQCQRIALARALAADPALVLADEPTAALDAQAGQSAIELLRRLTADVGKTAVIVTHDHRILHHADRVLDVNCGALAERDLTPARSTNQAAVTAARGAAGLPDPTDEWRSGGFDVRSASTGEPVHA